MTVQSLKTIDESGPDLEQTQALKLGRGHAKKKMSDTIFSKVVSLTLK